MIIWGSKVRTKKLSHGQFHCPKCNTSRDYHLKRTVRSFTLYFIPLFPIEKGGYFVECQTCASSFAPTVLPGDQLAAMISTLKPGREEGYPVEMPTEAYALGNVKAKFRVRTGTSTVRLFFLLIVFGVMIAGCGGLVLLWEFNHEAFGVFVVGMTMIISGALIAVYSRRTRRSEQALVCQDGLVDIRKSKTTVLCWEDIAAIRQAVVGEQQYLIASFGLPVPIPIPIRKEYRYYVYVHGRNGEYLEYTDDTVGNVEALCRIIQREVTKRLLPRAIKTFESGGAVDFGTLSLSREGLRRGKETISWNEIADITFNKWGQIIVNKEGESSSWARVYIGQTHNIFVFMALIERMTRVNFTQQASLVSMLHNLAK